MSFSSSVFWPVSGSNSVIELHLVAEQRDAPGAVLQMRREQLDGVAAHAEGAADEIAVAAAVVQRHEVGQQLALGQALAGLHREGHGRVGLDRADAVDARHGRDDDDVVALEQGARGGVAHAVDLLVHRRFLLDVGVGARHVGFGLVVVVVGDEVLDRVVGEEAPELAVELGRQRLVGGEHQGGALRAGNHLGGGVGLARAGDAQQHLVALVLLDAGHQLGDGGGLVALGLVLRHQREGDAALGLLGPRRAVRLERRHAARDQRVRRDHRLLGQHLAGALGALVRLGQDGVERRRHALDAARGRGGVAQRGEGGGGRGQERRLRGLGEAGRGRALGLGRAAGPLGRRGGRLAGLAARGARAGRRVGGLLGGAGHGGDIWRGARLCSSVPRTAAEPPDNPQGMAATTLKRTHTSRRTFLTHLHRKPQLKWRRIVVWGMRWTDRRYRAGVAVGGPRLIGYLAVFGSSLGGYAGSGALGDRGRGHRASGGVASPILGPVRAWTRSGSPTTHRCSHAAQLRQRPSGCRRCLWRRVAAAHRLNAVAANSAVVVAALRCTVAPGPTRLAPQREGAVCCYRKTTRASGCGPRTSLYAVSARLSCCCSLLVMVVESTSNERLDIVQITLLDGFPTPKRGILAL